MKHEAEFTRTSRGFELIRFQDASGEKCSLQQSSIAHYNEPGTSCIWLGIGESRMHLTRGQVRWLKEILHKWSEVGSFAPVRTCYSDWPEDET